jgi:general stress protein 26
MNYLCALIKVMDERSSEYQKIMEYITAHPAAVVSSINDDGSPHAAVVYIFPVSHHTVCFITRNLTHKYQNIYQRSQVAITIFDERDSSTLQAAGKAFVANNEQMLSTMQSKMERLHAVRADSMPPIEKLQQSGDYVLVGIELQTARLAQYQGLDISLDGAFTEIAADK